MTESAAVPAVPPGGKTAPGLRPRAPCAPPPPRLRALAAGARQDERRRLALELHDGLLQSLALALAQLQGVRARVAAGETALSEPLGGVAETLSAAAAEARRIVQGLHPHALRGRGLADALRDWTTEFAERSGLAVELRLSGAVTSCEAWLGLGGQTHVLRIAQEALHNVRRHAHASRATVCLDASRPARLVLEVSDDGEGFAPGALTSAGGHGLQGMRERALQLGSELVVGRSATGGALVRLSLLRPS